MMYVSDVVYRQCQLTSVDQVNHDTNLYKLTLPQGTRMIVPLGYHVRLKAQIEGNSVMPLDKYRRNQ